MLDMKWILVFVALLTTALAQEPTTTKPTTSSATPTTNATDATTSSSTTTSSSSTSTSTSKPTEPSSSTETTTSSTAPTSTNAPSTTAAPSEDGTKYFVEPCLLARLNLNLTINYNSTNGTKTTFFSLLNASKTDLSSCNVSGNELLQLKGGPITLSLTFSTKDDNAYLSSVKLVYDLNNKDFPDATGQGQQETDVTNLELFKVKKGKSYICTNDKSIEFPDKVATLFVKHIQVEAFTNKTATDDFSASEDCAQANDVSDIVPIAVGCALAGLVVIVLIAYLVGRRRSRQKGYQSV